MTFTQADISAGLITYQNDGDHVGLDTAWSDSFIFQLSDGVSTFSNQVFTLSINDVDDPSVYGPLLAIDVDEGASVNFSNVELQILDVDTPDCGITITVRNLKSGVVKLNGGTVSDFTLADLKAGGLLF